MLYGRPEPTVTIDESLHRHRHHVQPAQDEPVPLILQRRPALVVGIEPDRQPGRIRGRSALPVVLRDERALEVGGVVLGLRQRVARQELVAIAEALGQRERQAAIPRLAERRVLKNRRRGAGATVHVFGPAAGAERRHDRVVVDRAELLEPAHVDEVRRQRDLAAELAIDAERRVMRVRRLQSGIDRDLQARERRAPARGSRWPGAFHAASRRGQAGDEASARCCRR